MKASNSAIWALAWAILLVVLLIGQIQQKLDRDNERLHAAVEASMVPPSTANVRTP